VFALSGAGCYLILLKALIRELLPDLRSGKLTLCIAAGDNHKARAEIESHLAALNVRLTAEGGCATSPDGVKILYSPDTLESFGLFNRALRESDLLITKPGELVFYAALGVPQVLLPPVGKHEFKNRAYLMENSAALDLPGVESAGAWLLAQRANGAWRRAAESACERLPKLGTFVINDVVGS
jgi:UDP-N-acetylglucosamine:LPS N-acetylglucosamine transferase